MHAEQMQNTSVQALPLLHEEKTSDIVSCIRDQLRSLHQKSVLKLLFPLPSIEVFFPGIGSDDIIERQQSMERTMKLSEDTLLLAVLTG